jgi:TolC family type I secretion outer membrane protein
MKLGSGGPRRFCLWAALLGLGIFVVGSFAQSAEAPAASPPALALPLSPPISLAEAIKTALAHNPQTALAEAGVISASGQTKTAAAGLLPSVSLSSQYSKSGPDTLGSDTSASVSVSGRQLLYDFGATAANVSQARHREEATRQSYAQTRQDIINQVKQTYYTLLQNQRLVEVQQQNVADSQANLNLANARFGAGLAARADVIKAETALASANFNLISAKNAAELSRLDLNLAMGIDGNTPTEVKDSEESAPPLTDRPALVAQALSARPEMLSAKASLEAAKQNLRAARVGNAPAFNLNADYGLQGTSFPPHDDGWSYGASVSFPLFDGGANAGQIKTAQGNLQSAEAQLRQSEQTVGSEVITAYLNLRTAEEKIIASAAEVANAEENFRLTTGRYQAGLATYIEVTDAETALVSARTNQVNAQYDLSIARAALKRALGEGENQ